MNKKELCVLIRHLGLHYGETIECDWRFSPDNSWSETELEINTYFILELEKGNIRNPKIPMTGLDYILDERIRQIEEEKFDEAHDDYYDSDEFPRAACCYITPQWSRGNLKEGLLAATWPWNRSWWKPGPNRQRELIKGGALVAAEIDRIQRHEKE